MLNLYHKKRDIMLKNTFVHVPGIGIKSEQKIWSSGIYSWDDLLIGECSLFNPVKRDRLKRSIEESHEQLSKFTPEFFEARMPSAHHWRIFPEFRESIAYLDIETTGLYSWSDQVTTIAVYDGKSIVTYVQGQNLHEFKEDIQKYRVLVTYNGKCFDVPFLESYFGIKLNQVHIDLRYVLRSLGYMGGLKGCEKKAGIDRGNLEGVDGYFAVSLWNEYQRDKNHKALDTLLAYNIQDVVNLETLMVLSYNLKLRETPFSETHQLDLPLSPEIPFKADLETMDRIRGSIGSYMGWR
jgi:uncharacterized protein